MQKQTSQQVYREAIWAAQRIRNFQEINRNRIKRESVHGTDALNRQAAGAPFVPHAKTQEAHAKFLQTCKHRTPQRRNIHSADGKIRASLGLELELA